MDFVFAKSRVSGYGIKATLPTTEITAVGRGMYP